MVTENKVRKPKRKKRVEDLKTHEISELKPKRQTKDRNRSKIRQSIGGLNTVKGLHKVIGVILGLNVQVGGGIIL